MKKLLLLTAIALGLNTIQAQTMYVRPMVGSQTAYPVNNIQKLTFDNGNLIVTNTTGPSGTFALADNRYINFTDLTLGTNSSVVTESKFYVYPNPSSQWLNISSSNTLHRVSQIEILSLEGRLLMQQKPANESATQVNISALPQGMYLCRITSGNQQQTLKFLKQ